MSVKGSGEGGHGSPEPLRAIRCPGCRCHTCRSRSHRVRSPWGTRSGHRSRRPPCRRNRSGSPGSGTPARNPARTFNVVLLLMGRMVSSLSCGSAFNDSLAHRKRFADLMSKRHAERQSRFLRSADRDRLIVVGTIALLWVVGWVWWLEGPGTVLGGFSSARDGPDRREGRAGSTQPWPRGQTRR